MYAQSSYPHPTSSLSTARQRRPDLSLIKSPCWSHPCSIEQAYPSPPMSDTPTFPRRPSVYPEQSSSSVGLPSSYATSQSRPPHIPATTTMEGPMLAAAPAYQQSPYGQDLRGYYPPATRPELQPRPVSTHSAYPPHRYDSYYAQSSAPVPLVPTARYSMPAPVTYQGPTSVVNVSTTRPQKSTRRAKTHVAKACQNCKKAHLSCDEARPCARCVASGKQSTCIDVEHKKRGRPRLRDDREQRLEQAAAVAAATPQPSLQGPGPVRGHHRGDSLRDSFRTLRSQQLYGSDSDTSRPSTSQGMSPGSSYMASSASYSSPYGAPSSIPPSNTLWSALLNLNLQFLKCSPALQNLLGPSLSNLNVVERSLRDVVTPQFEPILQRLQNDLRDERARREPNYLPAIYPDQQERAAVRDHDPQEADSLSRDFMDRQDIYTFVVASGRTERFQVRIRLARTSTFFATMVLYQLQPPPLAPALAPAFTRGSQYAPGDPSSPARSPYATSNPGSPFSSLAPSLMTTLPPPSSIPASYIYAPSQGIEQGYFRPSMQPPPPPSQVRPGTSGSRGPPVQLPPIVSSAPTTPTSQLIEAGTTLPTPIAGSASSRRRTSPERGASGDEEGTNKRRRLNIGDIVEK